MQGSVCKLFFLLVFIKTPIIHLTNEIKVLKNTKKCLKVNKNDLWGCHRSRCLSMGRHMGVEPIHARFTAECVHRFTNGAAAGIYYEY